MSQLIKIESISKNDPGQPVEIDGTGRGNKDSSCILFQSPGSIGVPVKDEGVTISIGENRIIVATNDYSFSLNLSTGDKIIYSRDSDGNVKSYTWHKSDGTILIKNNNGSHEVKPDGSHVINDGATSSVKFTELKTGFDLLVANFNTEISKIAAVLNAILPGSYTATPSVATIDASEVSKIKVP